MATNRLGWVGNMYGIPEPMVRLGNFQAGSTQAIKRGEILEFTGASNTAWVPIDSDFSMSGSVCVANEEIKSGDLAGYYEVIVPRPGDIFEFDLAAAGATAYGTALYYSSSEAVTVTVGSNIIGYSCGQENYPLGQGHLADGEIGDKGTTIKSQTKVRMTFKASASLFAKFSV